MGRRGRRSQSARRQARDAFGRFAATPSPGFTDSTSTPPARRWTSAMGNGSTSTKGSRGGTPAGLAGPFSGKHPRRSFAGLAGPSSGKRRRVSSAGLADPSSGKSPRRSSARLVGPSSGKRRIPRSSAMGPIRPTSGTGPSRRASVRARKSPNLPGKIIFVSSDSDNDTTNINKQAPARPKGRQATVHCCTLHEWRAREKGKEAAARDKGKQRAGSEKGKEGAARGRLAIPEKELVRKQTFRFKKIKATVRYSDDTDDENETMILTRSQLAQKAEELRVALKWRCKYGDSDSEDSDA